MILKLERKPSDFSETVQNLEKGNRELQQGCEVCMDKEVQPDKSYANMYANKIRKQAEMSLQEQRDRVSRSS